MFRFRKNSKGFTLIELLGVIVIIGILSSIAITAVSKLINKAKTSSDETLEKSAKMAAESYMQANKDEMPKSIGETVKISLQKLSDSKYLDTLKNSKGENCTDNTYSYVIVYKRSNKEYVYTPHICCGDSECKESNSNIQPSIDIEYGDLGKVNDSTFTIQIYGDNTSHNTELDSYSYTISTGNSDNSTELYNSGSINAHKEKDVKVNGKLSDYIDVTKGTSFTINVTAINSYGVSKSFSKSSKFEDTVPPKCGDISGQANGDTDWINIEKYKAGQVRNISIGCSDPSKLNSDGSYSNDNLGSGCKRSVFSATWPNNSSKYVQNGIIKIYDNVKNKANGETETGNFNTCKVLVNIDLSLPTASLTAKSGDKSVLKSININSGRDKATIKSSSYSNTVKGWLNKSNYPNGISYTIKANDDYLYSWEWKVNQPGQRVINKNDLSSSYTDGASGTFSSTTNITTSAKINFNFTAEGKRYGVLTIKDRAGNSISYEIYANIDRTGPNISSISVKSQDTRYNTETVNVSVSATDNLSNLKVCTSNNDDTCSDYKDYSNNPSTYEHKVINGYDGGVKIINVYAKDEAGNVTKSSDSSYRTYVQCSSTETTGDWYDVGSCSASCGGGKQKQHLNKKDVYLGSSCGYNERERDCNLKSCYEKNSCMYAGRTRRYVSYVNGNCYTSNQGFYHYCTDSNGNLYHPTFEKAETNEDVYFQYFCPSNNLDSKQVGEKFTLFGKTYIIIDDSNM